MNAASTRFTLRARQFSRVSALCAVTLLSACGGGGDAPAPAPVPPPVAAPPAISQDGASNFAKLAGTSQVAYEQMSVSHMVFAASYMQGFSSVGGGSAGPTTQACPQGGTFTVTVTKAGNYTGFRSGDTVTSAFSRCFFGTSRFNGTLALTPSVATANLPASSFSVALNVRTQDFRMDLPNGYSASTNGSVTLSMSLSTAANGAVSYNAQVAAPSSYAYSLFTSAAVTAPSLTLTTTNLSSIASASSAIFNVANNMAVVYSAPGGGDVGYTLTTTSALSGPIVAGRGSAPTTGSFRLSNISGFPGAIITVSIAGATATVAVDTNGDGVTNYSFTITSASLVSL